MTRIQAIANAADYFDRGAFKSDLARRVAIPSESQNPDARPELERYVRDEMMPALEALGFQTRVIEQAGAPGPFLYAERNEGEGRPTVLGYGHGDVIRGLAKSWHAGIGKDFAAVIDRDLPVWKDVVEKSGARAE